VILILSQKNLVHNFPNYFPKIQSNIFFPSTRKITDEKRKESEYQHIKKNNLPSVYPVSDRLRSKKEGKKSSFYGPSPQIPRPSSHRNQEELLQPTVIPIHYLGLPEVKDEINKNNKNRGKNWTEQKS
jgi:hypothetical protein